MTTTTSKTTSKTPQRKHTRASEEKRKSFLDQGFRLKLDGEVLKVSAGDLTALDTRALRQNTGLTFPALLEQTATDFDIDTLACMIWLARRVNGERDLSFDEVAAEVGYDDLEMLKVTDEEADAAEAETAGE